MPTWWLLITHDVNNRTARLSGTVPGPCCRETATVGRREGSRGPGDLVRPEIRLSATWCDLARTLLLPLDTHGDDSGVEQGQVEIVELVIDEHLPGL